MRKLAEILESGKNLYSISEFCEKLKISRPTLWRWEKQGIVKGIRIGRKVYYSDDCILKNK